MPESPDEGGGVGDEEGGGVCVPEPSDAFGSTLASDFPIIPKKSPSMAYFGWDDRADASPVVRGRTKSRMSSRLGPYFTSEGTALPTAPITSP